MKLIKRFGAIHVAFALCVLVLAWSELAFGKVGPKGRHPPAIETFGRNQMHDRNDHDVHAVIGSLNERDYALTPNMTKMINVIQNILQKAGYELVSIGESLHYSLKDVIVRHIDSGVFMVCKSVTFLPNPVTGLEVEKMIFTR